MKDKNIEGLTEKDVRRLYWAVWVFLILGIMGSIWGGFKTYVFKLNMGYYKSQPSLPPDQGYARYEIGRYKFQIPIAYHYTIYEMRGNRWLDDGLPIQHVGGGVIFDVFLPDFKSIGLDAFSEPKIFKEKHIYISIADKSGEYPIEKVIENYKQSRWYQDINSYPQGLWGFYHTGAKETFYFERDQKDAYFLMTCKFICTADVVYKQYPTLKIHYSYDGRNLQDWYRINDGIRQKLDEFRVSQFN